MIFRSILRFAPAAVVAGMVGGLCAQAAAQGMPPPPGAPPAGAQNQTCIRLESQLAALDRGQVDPVRADQIRRYEEAAGRQQAELDRLTAHARKQGCEASGFFLFGGGGGPQCGDINGQIERMRASLARMTGDLQRLQSGGGDRGEQRRALLIALNQNDCGPQYANAVPPRPRGFFETLFGGPAPATTAPGPDWNNPNPDMGQSSTFRTVCVRTCDGYFYPISFSTVPSKFADDDRVCQRTCPAAEVMLYSHRNPGEDISQAVSLTGKRYTDLPAAFHYRQEYTPACSCRRPGQSWAEALGTRDETLERGDIVVTEERAKAMAQPKLDAPKDSKTARQDSRAKGKPDTRIDTAPLPDTTATTDVQAAAPAPPPDRSKIRAVGPQFIPPR
jgi:hypothetical protein